MERLLTSPALGGLFLLLLFAGCFLLVHICLLVKIGWNHKSGTSAPSPEKKAEEKPVSKPPEPVYYIVEKKRKKPKTSYSEPKEFHFK